MISISSFKRHSNLLSILLVLIITACVSTGPTKPNEPFGGNSYPAELAELSTKNHLLIMELGKLPEMQDGISESESIALKKLAELYNLDSDAFDKAFEEMYQEGLPGVRKYCSPLQAFFWLAEAGNLEACNKILNNYTLYDLLLIAWDFQETLNLTMEQLRIIINTLPQKQQRLYDGVTQRNIANNITSALYEHYQGLFPKESKKLIKDGISHTKYHIRWGNYDTVVERLNSPELINYYEQANFKYVSHGGCPGFAKIIFKYKNGCCSDYTAFSERCLRKAGYNAWAIQVASPSGKAYHVVCEYKDKDGKEYIMDVDCFSCTGGKGVLEKKEYLKRLPQIGVGYQ